VYFFPVSLVMWTRRVLIVYAPSAFDPTGVTRMQEGQRKCWPSNASSFAKILIYLNDIQAPENGLNLISGGITAASRLSAPQMPDHSRGRGNS
jgi:hypothetical protein